MRYLSLFSGIEAASVAWHDLGWTPVAFAEIEKFPSAVLKHRFPNVPNWGDVTKYQEWPDADIDVLVGGSPCQSFSVAGLRKGLADPRGNLMLTYLAIAQRYRPRWVVWENVPGVLSSNQGRDFGTFLGGLGECGYGFAYRVLDAQFVRTRQHPGAVPQRRRRVFVVGHLGDWRRAAAVFLNAQSLSGNPPPSRKTGQRFAGGAAGGVASGGIPEVAQTLSSRDHKGPSCGRDGLVGNPIAVARYLGNAEGGAREVPFLTCHNIGGTAGISNQTPLVAHALRGEGFDASEDGTGRGTPLVPVSMRESGQGYWMEDVVAGTIDANMGMSGHANRPAVIAQPVAFHPTQDPISSEDGTTHAMGCGSKGGAATVAVAQPVAFRDTADCLTAAYGTKWNGNASADNGSLFAAQPVAHSLRGEGFDASEDGTGRGIPLVPVGKGSHWDDPRNPRPTLNQASQGSGAIGYGNQELFAQRGGGLVPDIAPTLDQRAGRSGENSFATSGGLVPVGTDLYNGAMTGDIAATMGTNGSSINGSGPTVLQPLATDIKQVQWASGGGQVENDTAQALRSNAEYNYQFARVAMRVRRLMPVECERLQGFPDGWTDVPWRGKPTSPDGPRYKALGNSMAVNCMRWIGERIQQVEDIHGD